MQGFDEDNLVKKFNHRCKVHVPNGLAVYVRNRLTGSFLVLAC
jgi:hypothetical protein